MFIMELLKNACVILFFSVHTSTKLAHICTGQDNELYKKTDYFTCNERNVVT